MLFKKSHYLNRLGFRLDEALAITSKASGGYNYEFSAAEEFHSALMESTNRLKAGDKNQIENLQRWFHPSGAWDEFVDMQDKPLANDIEHLIHKITR